MKLSPEKSMEVQRALGADLVVVLDECTSSTISKEETAESMKRSHDWEDRSLQNFLCHNDGSQALYGIVQGGIYPDLRKESCDYVNSRDFFGIAVGGCLGTTTEEMHRVVNMTMKMLRKDRPVHLLGIGYIQDVFNAVKNGVDTLDCVHPTRVARHGVALVKFSPYQTDKENRKNGLNLNQTKFADDDKAIDPTCKCTTCTSVKRSYLHLLIKSNELMYQTLITNHNIYFMNRLMCDIRNGIENGNLEEVQIDYLGS
jgi:queuine tRNA-ribosyltransferase